MDETLKIYPYIGNKDFYSRALPFIYGATFLLTIMSLLGEGSFIFLPAMIVLVVLLKLFGTDAYPPVIFIALLYQWIQVSIKPIYATLTFTSLEELAEFPDNIVTAYLLSCFGLLVMALGIYTAVRKIHIVPKQIINYIDELDTRKTLVAYLSFSLFASLLYGLRFIVPGLFQGIVALGYIKWTLFFFAFYSALKKNEQRPLLNAIIVFEFISGFASFFADFKTIVFMVAIAYLALYRIKQKQLVYLAIAAFAFGYVGTMWTAVKSDYRQFLNQDSATQQVKVSNSEALNYLADHIFDISARSYEEALENTIDRISYIDYFSSCIAYVPAVVDHEGGQLSKAAVMHILVPRLFNPDKPAIDDSVHLTKYTGVFYANASYGVSFALGYVPDFYIDFGPVFMFLALLIFGRMIGAIILSIHRTSINTFWGMAIMLPLFIIMYKFENSLIKFFGNLIMFWLVAMLFNKYLCSKVDGFLRDKR